MPSISSWYAIHFRTIAAGSGWNNESLVVCFQKGLSEALKDELATQEPSNDLEALIDLAVRLDNRLRERKLSHQFVFTPPFSPVPTELLPLSQGSPEPMQLGGTRISPSERDRPDCLDISFLPAQSSWETLDPVQAGRTVTGITSIAPPSNSGLFLSITLAWGNHKKHLKAMVDSGAAGNFMDFSLARSLKVPTESLVIPLTVTALKGRPLRPGEVTLLTAPLYLSIHKHRKSCVSIWYGVQCFLWFSVTPGFFNITPTGAILSWGPTCHVTCLIQSSSDSTLESQEPLDLSQVPTQYHHLKAVFTKKKAMSLPPHCPSDCAIDLISGTCPPRGRIFSFSSPECAAMDNYIEEALAAGVIRPAGAGFFFVGKKDGGLRPCIDYRGLNKIGIWNRYPLRLMATAFELLQGASIFTKLDLRNSYHLWRIRQGWWVEDCI